MHELVIPFGLDDEKAKNTQTRSRVHLNGWAHDFALFRLEEMFFDLEIGLSALDKRFPRLSDGHLMLAIIQRDDLLRRMQKMKSDKPTLGMTRGEFS
jgi:hypothetical protein